MKPMLRDPEIPLAVCPYCRGGYMVIRTVKPRLRQRDGIDVEYACPKCEAVTVASVRPEVDRAVSGMTSSDGGLSA